MGKSAKFMRLGTHEKQKRVKKGGEWRESGIKIARRDAKKQKNLEKASLVFGSASGSGSGASSSGPTSTAKPVGAKTGSVFPGLAEKLWSEYRDADGAKG